jgi:FkbM family methyltransferase
MDHLQEHLIRKSNWEKIPDKHIVYLYNLKKSGFEPKVIYDIGACVLHWTKVAKELWPNAEIILFDAYPNAEFLYKDYRYHIGCLSDENDKIVKFYQNDYEPGGNSYYREIGYDNGKHFPEDRFTEMKTMTLDTVVEENGFPLPDFVKIDVQGAELDILNGGTNTIGNAKRLIVELQHTEYNEGAKLSNESLPIIESMGWRCCAPLFQNNGPDGDYGFCKDIPFAWENR